MEQSVCLSGAAKGADTLFGKCAERMGHDVVHFGFAGMETHGNEHVKVLTCTELEAADGPVRRAAESLRRNTPTKPYVSNLIRRNFYQVKTAERVYAVSRWNQRSKISFVTTEGELGGGTGWAVQMALDLRVPEVYFFAIERRQWYMYRYGDHHGSWERLTATPPKPFGRYAGIGSRDLGKDGEDAIQSLYELNEIIF